MKKIELEYHRQNHKSAALVRDMNDMATQKLTENFRLLEQSLPTWTF